MKEYDVKYRRDGLCPSYVTYRVKAIGPHDAINQTTDLIYSKLAESIKCKGDLLVTYEFISCKIVPRETLS